MRRREFFGNGGYNLVNNTWLSCGAAELFDECHWSFYFSDQCLEEECVQGVDASRFGDGSDGGSSSGGGICNAGGIAGAFKGGVVIDNGGVYHGGVKSGGRGDMGTGSNNDTGMRMISSEIFDQGKEKLK